MALDYINALTGGTVPTVDAAGETALMTGQRALCRTADGAVTVSLPDAVAPEGAFVVIDDADGNAAANNVTIDPGSGTIDGESSLVLSTDNAVVALVGIASSPGPAWTRVAIPRVVPADVPPSPVYPSSEVGGGGGGGALPGDEGEVLLSDGVGGAIVTPKLAWNTDTDGLELGDGPVATDALLRVAKDAFVLAARISDDTADLAVLDLDGNDKLWIGGDRNGDRPCNITNISANSRIELQLFPSTVVAQAELVGGEGSLRANYNLAVSPVFAPDYGGNGRGVVQVITQIPAETAPTHGSLVQIVSQDQQLQELKGSGFAMPMSPLAQARFSLDGGLTVEFSIGCSLALGDPGEIVVTLTNGESAVTSIAAINVAGMPDDDYTFGWEDTDATTKSLWSTVGGVGQFPPGLQFTAWRIMTQPP